MKGFEEIFDEAFLTKKAEFDAITVKQDELRKVLDGFEKEYQAIILAKWKIMSELIVTSGVLSMVKWEIQNYPRSTYLSCRFGGVGKQVSDLLYSLWVTGNYHDKIELSPDVTLRTDDGDLTLIFKDDIVLKEFIAKHKLQFDFSTLEQKNAQLQRDIDANNAIIAGVNSWMKGDT